MKRVVYFLEVQLRSFFFGGGGGCSPCCSGGGESCHLPSSSVHALSPSFSPSLWTSPFPKLSLLTFCLLFVFGGAAAAAAAAHAHAHTTRAPTAYLFSVSRRCCCCCCCCCCYCCIRCVFSFPPCSLFFCRSFVLLLLSSSVVYLLIE